MNARREPCAIRCAIALHGLFVRLCPRAFRQRFGTELEQTLRAAGRAAHQRGSFALACVAGRACAAAAFTALRLRMEASSSFARTLAVLPVAILLAAFAGYVDQNAEEVHVPALLVFVTAFVCSCLQPRAAWLWWLLAGSSIPVAMTIAAWLGHQAPFAESAPFSWLVAFVPALLGAIAGVGLRHALPMKRPPAAA